MRLWVSPPLKAGVFLISQLVSAGDAKETKHPHTPTPTPHTWLSSTLSADSTTWPVSASVSRCLASRGSSRRSSGQASMFRRSAVKSTYIFIRRVSFRQGGDQQSGDERTGLHVLCAWRVGDKVVHTKRE